MVSVPTWKMPLARNRGCSLRVAAVEGPAACRAPPSSLSSLSSSCLRRPVVGIAVHQGLILSWICMQLRKRVTDTSHQLKLSSILADVSFFLLDKDEVWRNAYVQLHIGAAEGKASACELAHPGIALAQRPSRWRPRSGR